MRPHRAAPPLWFSVCVAVALAFALRWALAIPPPLTPAGGHTPDVVYGFWTFIIAIAGAIFKGLQVAAKVTLNALSWSVKALWWFATVTANGLKFLGKEVLFGLKKAWQFFKLTYDTVIKPAFLKLQTWYRATRDWLKATFGPVLEFLKTVRDTLLCFYKTWVRPWLDLIDVTRRLLRILAALGLDWAKALDKKLGSLEALIDKPFRIVLGKVNEIINLVNTVITAGGLFQRVALIRSLERDYIFAWRAATNPWRRLISDDEWKARPGGKDPKTVQEIAADTRAYMVNHGGPNAAVLNEMAAQWRIYLRN
jgi:hypothetical protein